MIQAYISQWVEEKSTKVTFILSVLCYLFIFLTGICDYFIESINVFIFYTFLVVFASLFISKSSGIIASVFAATSNFFTNKKFLMYDNIAIIYFDFLVDLALFLFISFLVYQLRKALLREKKISRRDFLTGLGNRRFFMEKLNEKNYNFQNEYSVCYMDIDLFNTFLEERGMPEADRMIKTAAKFIKARYPNVFRFEEDRFMIVFNENDGYTAFTKMSELKKDLQLYLARHNLSITFSVGIVFVSKEGFKITRILSVLFKVIQKIKQENGNQIKYVVLD